MLDVGNSASQHDRAEQALSRAAPPGAGDEAQADERSVPERLFGLLPDAVMMIDGEAHVRYVNPACVELVGAKSADDVVGRSVWSFVHPDEEQHARDREVQLRRGRQVDYAEQRLVRVDGQVVPIETATVPVVLPDGRGVLITARNLTARKLMEHALNESRELFVKAFRLGPAAATVSRLSDATIIDVNAQFLELTGYTRQELVGHSAVALGIWQDPEARRRLYRLVEARGTAKDVEVAICRKDGRVRDVISSLQRIEVQGEACVLAISIDVTERHRAAQAERENRALFRKIFSASPTAIAISRLGGGTIIEVNDAWCRLTGFSREDVMGRTTADLGLWDGEALPAALSLEAAEQEPLQDHEIELRRKSGEARTALVSVQEMRVEGEQCQLAVLVDITERKLTENKLREAKEHAEEMARLKSTFLTNLTHEIRTPLTVILGFTSILRQGVRKEYARFVQLIERSGRRLLLMLDSMLDLAQLEAGTLNVEQRPYSLADVVSSVLQSLRPLASDKGLDLNFEAPETRVYARLDHAVLTRVLNNVLDNAIKFTETGRIDVRLEGDGDWARIRIRDTGIGIDETFLPLVFEPFSQESTGLERTHQGSGLGLSVSRRLIELMGGRIEVPSRKGEGSVFTIVLPREP